MCADQKSVPITTQQDKCIFEGNNQFPILQLYRQFQAFQILLMNITLKNKAVQKQLTLKKLSQLQFLSGAFSKQIKDCFQSVPSQISAKSRNVINLAVRKKKIDHPDNGKVSISTTASTYSCRYQTTQKFRKIPTKNPQVQSIFKQHLTQLDSKCNRYAIRWRSSQSKITKLMRVTLGEWLLQLSQQIQIPKDSVYNAMHYTDKYVSMVNVSQSKYQSIGLCSLFIASKLQISNHPSICTFIAAMAGTITKEQLINLQQSMLVKLQFRLTPPTLYQYMVLIVSLFNNFVLKNHPNFIKILPKTSIYYDLFWVLDGVHLEGDYRSFNKEKVCLIIKKSTYQKNDGAVRKLYMDLESGNSVGEVEQKFQQFLVTCIQIYKRINQIKECISMNRKWVKYERISESKQEEIQDLKRIILSE